MLTGTTPFTGRTKKELMVSIVTKKPKIPLKASLEITDLLKRLLCKSGMRRLGAKGDGAEIKAHPFFKNVNWEAILRNKDVPPTLSSIENGVDFHTDDESLEPTEEDSTYHDKQSFSDSYSDFTYVQSNDNNESFGLCK